MILWVLQAFENQTEENTITLATDYPQIQKPLSAFQEYLRLILLGTYVTELSFPVYAWPFSALLRC